MKYLSRYYLLTHSGETANPPQSEFDEDEDNVFHSNDTEVVNNCKVSFFICIRNDLDIIPFVAMYQWVQHRSETGEAYYHNTKTGETSWDEPESKLLLKVDN